jgi:signal transduction histidine kinase/streptogramin lyase
MRVYRHDPDDPRSLGPGPITALAADAAGGLWIGTAGGLSRRDPGADGFRSWRHVRGDDASLPAGAVTAVRPATDGRVWVGTGSGLARFDPATGSAERFAHEPDDPRSLADDTVLSLHVDRAGRLWVATYRGLSRLDPDAEGFTHFRLDPDDPGSLGSNYVYFFHEESDGALWLGTAGGLDLLRPGSERFEHRTPRDGLPNGVIAGVLPDDEGRLWLSTHRGLVRLDPSTNAIETYGPADGLRSNLYRAGAAVRTADGELVFGGAGGYDAFRPDDIRTSRASPPVVVTELGGPEIETAPWADVSALRTVELGPRQNDFTIEFAALDFRRPERIRYAYRLEGFDDDWIDAGTRAAAAYTNVPPGDYVFRARATNSDGVWSESEAELSISIAPPFWRTAGFLAIVVGAGLALVLLGHAWRVRARIRRALEIEQARADERERVRRRVASDFHDELGHRLTKIGLFSEVVRRELRGTPSSVADYLDRIVAEARRLSDETRDFLWSMDPRGETLHDLVTHLVEFAEDLFDRTDVEFVVEGLDEELRSLQLSMDHRRHITSIFKEAMNNALRHAECTRVTLAVGIEGPEFTLSLADDGRGWARPAAEEASGRGLRNMELRARRIDGRIRITSDPGAGSTIVLSRRARLITASR